MVDDIDYTAQAVLRDIEAELRAKSIRLVFAENVTRANATSRKEIENQFGKASYFTSLRTLAAAYDAAETRPAGASELPHAQPPV